MNRMDAGFWIDATATSLIDIGCNVGELLATCRRLRPSMRLAGVEVNAAAAEVARRNVPDAHIELVTGPALPFESRAFDYAACIEVLEHVPCQDRKALLAEIRRVLRPGGRLLLRTPHAGLFSWLDPNNFRFRFPRLYRRFVSGGGRDGGYVNGSNGIVFHHHFDCSELLSLAGEGWELISVRRGGLFLVPLADTLLWPFYRARRPGHWIARMLQRALAWDLGVNYGKWSYDILLVLARVE